MRILTFTLFLIFLISLSGCQEEVQQPTEQANQVTNQVTKEQVVSELTSALTEDRAKKEDSPEQTEKEPPSPPIFEDFQGEPQLSLFPRAGDFRPEDDSDRLPYWNTFIEHLIKVTGVVEEQTSGTRGWTFRSINTIDSVGFFSPLAVEPQTAYQVSFKLSADLPEEASAGIGILEFNEFLWIPGQYTEEIYKQHYRGGNEGKSVSGKTNDEHTFTFTTGPETKMIHVVLFREGTHDRNAVMFDDIGIELVERKQ